MKSTLRNKLWACLLGMLLITGFASAQSITSSAIAGRVLDAAGNGVEGATVRAVHVPTGSVYRTTSRSNGRFNFANVRVGGPYSVSAESVGLRPGTASNVYTSLTQTTNVELRMAIDEGEVIDLEAFEVEANQGREIFDPNLSGVGSSFMAQDVISAPTARRHINDVARLNPFIAITDLNRNELSAAGQNSRFNSVMLDGVRINDQFGLASSGVQSFRNPISFDAIEAISVDISPYDVRQSGFTGAAINAVTKSGTNEFSGSLYTYYFDDSLRGDIDGRNDYLEELTYGATLGGPIIKDKLFFFVYYEKFEQKSSGGTPGFDPDPDAVAELENFNASLPFDFGNFGGGGVRTQPEEKYLVKLDWNITEDHQLAVKYQKTQGEDPNVGNFDDFGETAFDSNAYTQIRNEEFWSAQLYSQWSDNLETEISFGYNRYRQPTVFDALTPQIEIRDFPVDDGIAGSYTPGNGEMFLGTEQFRHANVLNVDTYNFSAVADYFLGDIVLTFGMDMEDTSFSNLFLESSFGNFRFESLADYYAGTIADTTQANYRNTGVTGQNPVADSDYTVTGAFVQARWDVSDKLRTTFGLRMDYTTSGSTPPVAFDANGDSFESLFGIPNNGTVDGNLLISPRFSFNYKFDSEHDIQLRGGIGVFQGRAPGVWLSNAFTNNGETSNRIEFAGDPSFDFYNYLNTQLDANNPILYIGKADGVPTIDATEPDLSLPWVVRGNLALDFRLAPESPWVATLEALYTKNYDTLWVQNINMAVSGFAPDGREIYSGRNVSTIGNVYLLRNADEGDATNLSVGLEREMRDGWFARFNYVLGDASEINPFTSSRAVSNFRNRQLFNANDPELGASVAEIKHRFLLTAGVEFELVPQFTTRVTAVYEARTGRPYSVVFASDINGDGDRDNDLLYIPTGANDPLVSFAPGFDQAAFFAFLDETGLSDYAGGAAPRGSQQNDWVHTLDLKLEQDIPVWKQAKLTFFVDFLNVLNMIDDGWGRVEEFGFPYQQRAVSASINPAGQYEYTSFSPDGNRVQTGDTRSRWAIQLGARLSF